MFSREKFNNAFNRVAHMFPFKGYMDSPSYFRAQAVAEALVQFYPSFEGKKLLDIGSGPMDTTAVLGALGFECFAVDDLSDPWHLIADHTDQIKAFAKQNELNFHHQQRGDYSIPFEKNFFDVVTSLSVIEHLHESPRGMLNTAGQHLQTGGYLVVVMPNSVNLRKRLSVLVGKTNYTPIDELFYSIGEYRGHVREYTLDETIQVCELMGFTVRYAKTFEHLAYTKLPPLLRQLYLMLGWLVPRFRSALLVVAQKPEGWAPLEVQEADYFRAVQHSVPGGLLPGQASCG